MSGHAGRTVSVWMDSTAVPQFPALGADTRADVCVVGAGIAGLSTAYFLCRAGKSVVVLDDGPVAGGETERTTAHLASALDDGFQELERLHGEKGARLAAESHAWAIDAIEEIVQRERIECDFLRVDGYLFNAPGMPEDLLEREFRAARRAGFEDLEWVDRTPLISYDTGPALLFPRQGQFHPLKYLAGLARAVEQAGGRIFTGTHVAEIHGGEPARVATSDGTNVECGAVVVATNTPVNDRVALHVQQRPYRTYVIGAAVPMGTVPMVLYWDTADPYHYVRLQPAGSHGPRPLRDILIVGGEDHETGQADDAEARFQRLEAWTRERFPMVTEIRFRWSGQVMEPVDSLAFIGRNPMDRENVFIATGDSGHGLTHGTIAGRLLTDLILGVQNRWADLYNPARLAPRALGEFVKDNVHMAAQYLDWLKAGDAEKETAIAPGTGAVVRRGLTKIAVYRDEQGRFHECSAVCPHLGGIVHWNHVEGTWDCPAHGSRFDCHGHVLNGPANQDLAEVKVQTESR